MLAATGGISSETVAGLQETPGPGTLSVTCHHTFPNPALYTCAPMCASLLLQVLRAAGTAAASTASRAAAATARLHARMLLPLWLP